MVLIAKNDFVMCLSNAQVVLPSGGSVGLSQGHKLRLVSFTLLSYELAHSSSYWAFRPNSVRAKLTCLFSELNT